MKTKILLTLGAVLLAVATFNVGAYNVAHSPRATANQIVIASSTAEPAAPAVVVSTPAPDVRTALSPRAAANQIAVTPGTQAPATTVKCTATGSPKYLAAAGSSARTSCCGLTLAACPSMSACAKVN